MLACPVGFVADHLEIKWDLDVEAADLAQELGLEFERIEMPNADPRFVGMLAGLVAGPCGTFESVIRPGEIRIDEVRAAFASTSEMRGRSRS